jgi:5-methylcytosine-specific restriction endonuclease McrA
MLVERFNIRIPIKWQIEADDELVEMRQRITDLMRHSNPSGDLAVIVKAAFALLDAQLQKTQLGKTDRPQKKGRKADESRVTKATRREVFARDGAQCTFRDATGERCRARGFLQIEHIHPKALGGPPKTENLRVLCQQHNRLHAERVFGHELVAKRIRSRRAAKAASLAGPPSGKVSPARRPSDVRD